MTRRRFGLMLAMLCGWPFAGSAGGRDAGRGAVASRRDSPPPGDGLAGLFYYLPDRSAVRRLGRAYVKRAASHAFPPVPASPAALETAIRADFAAGRVVALEGWIVSDTEARLAAALYLS